MKRVLFTCLLLVSTSAAADAQVLVYGVAGVSGVSGFFRSSTGFDAAGGGEALIKGMGGIGAEAGALGNVSSVLGRVSVDGVVHVIPSRPEHRVSPFVTSGWTHMSSGEGSFNAWNVGVGADVWAQPRVGVRVEFRDHVRPDTRGTVHYWTIRGGVAFR